MAMNTRDQLIAAWVELLQAVAELSATTVVKEMERKLGHTGHSVARGVTAGSEARSAVGVDAQIVSYAESIVAGCDGRYVVA